ncbi:MAG: putative small integral membrane protein [Candidatus Azotimanducaceae bacterium]|jgi:predicted small integral membrane protein
MTIRAWKAVFTAIFFLLVFSYAIQNVANITGGMYSSFAYVLSQSDHLAYPESVVPVITQPWLIWTVLLSVISLEFVCAALTGYGAWCMWKYREGTTQEFAEAKKQALNGLGLAVVIWFLLFGTFGAAVFQMWQTEIGASSFNGAFQITIYALILFGLISVED